MKAYDIAKLTTELKNDSLQYKSTDIKYITLFLVLVS